MKSIFKLFMLAVSFLTPGAWCASASGMALIKLTAVVDAISGSVRGTVFARNKGGAYIRGKGVVSNPNTVKQSAVRSIFTNIAQAWRALTASQRSAWNSAVSDYPYQNKLGETKQYSGFSLHQKLNLNLAAIDEAPIAAPLAPEGTAGLSDLTATVDVGAGDEITVTGSFPSFNPNCKYAVYATPSVSAGVSNVNKLFRQIGIAEGNGLGGLSTGYDAKAGYEAVFGVPSENETVGFKVRPINSLTGESGNDITYNATVVST